MTAESSLLESIVEILGRRHRLTDVDLGSGDFLLQDADHSVSVHLPPDLLEEYARQLDPSAIPDLSLAPEEDHQRIRARYISIWVSELFESDLDLSLVRVGLDRGHDGQVSLTDHRGPSGRSIPGADQRGYWSPDRGPD